MLGDRAYTRNDRNLEAEREEGEPVWAFPFKRKKGGELTAEQTLLNRMLAPLRAAIEHPFRILNRQFGHTKARYRGLFNNGQQIHLLFALGNLYHVRGRWQRPRDRSARRPGKRGRWEKKALVRGSIE